MTRRRSKPITRDEVLNLGDEDTQMKSIGVPVELSDDKPKLWKRPEYRKKHGAADIIKNRKDVNAVLIPSYMKDLRSKIYCFRKRGLTEQDISQMVGISVERLSIILPLGAGVDDD